MTTLLLFLGGFISGVIFFFLLFRIKKKGFEAIGNKILEEAAKEEKKLLEKTRLSCEQEELAKKQELDKKWQAFQLKIQKEETRIQKRETALENRAAIVESRILEFEKKQKNLEQKEMVLSSLKEELQAKEKTLEKDLESIATLTKEDAEEKLLKKWEESLSTHKVKRTALVLKEIEENCQNEAKKILITAISRLALPCTSEQTVLTVPLPNESIKGRIIGREGRNIRYLEELCGVNLVIDDTPSAILISGFDPIRKEIAKNALQLLIADGRIHPIRIEEVVDLCRENMAKEIHSLGSDAAMQAGVFSLHPLLIEHLGVLSFRTSIGQNVLKHSIEVSLLMGLLATELSLDAHLAKRIGLLHDIGKALPPAQEMSHALAGREFALKCGESEEVANGIGAHHDEIPSLTFEGALCAVADAISGSRPGARSLSLEKTFKRMQDLEALGMSFEGVTQAFALQAGKELRVIVSPHKVDDAGAACLASAIAQKIEESIPYSGKIKITLLRQARVISYAI